MAGFDNRSGFTFGDIVLATYAMPGQETEVPQPCVIVSSETYNQQRRDVLVMGIGVRDKSKLSSGEMTIQSFGTAGVDKGSAFKPVLVTIEQRLIRLILGHLENTDRKRLRHLLDLIIGR